MITDPDLPDQYPPRAALNTDCWEQSRTRLTQLLDADHIKILVRHYASVRRIRVLLQDPVELPTKRKEGVKVHMKAADVKKKRDVLLSSLANLAYLDGEAVRHKGQKYLGTLPEYYPESEHGSDDAQAEDSQNSTPKDGMTRSIG